MVNRTARRFLLPLAALGLAVALGGCVVYPAYPTYGYGYAEPHYYGGYGYYHGGYGWGGGGWRR